MQTTNKRIRGLYSMAFVCYLLPFLFLVLYFFTQPELLFWKMFLLGMFPFGLLGLLFTIIGTINAARDKNDRRKATGYYNLFMGIIVVAGGIIGWIVMYLESS